MKNTYIILMLVGFWTWSCTSEEPIKLDASFVTSFQRDGKTNALVDNAFYVLPTGSGEFITLYNGTAGHVWGEEGATGTDFNKADSLMVTYNTAGKYKLTLVATSSGDFGRKVITEVRTVEVNVVDDRLLITSFYINDANNTILYKGIITNDSIVFDVPDIVTNLNFKPVFNLQSPNAKVYVNNTEQTSGVNQIDFSQAVDYKVVSAINNTKIYHVKAHLIAASNEKFITKFNLAPNLGALVYNKSNGEVGSIDNTNSIINLSVNYGTVRTSTKLVLESSFLSSIFVNGSAYNPSKTNYNLNTITQIKVVAQNNSEKTYTLNLTDQDPITNFTFLGLIPAPVGVVDKQAKTITVNVLGGTDITNLVAKWQGTKGDVKVGGVLQINGTTANNYTNPVLYTFYKGTAAETYTVTVNVK